MSRDISRQCRTVGLGHAYEENMPTCMCCACVQVTIYAEVRKTKSLTSLVIVSRFPLLPISLKIQYTALGQRNLEFRSVFRIQERVGWVNFPGVVLQITTSTAIQKRYYIVVHKKGSSED